MHPRRSYCDDGKAARKNRPHRQLIQSFDARPRHQVSDLLPVDKISNRIQWR